jgi:hypothetical protein
MRVRRNCLRALRRLERASCEFLYYWKDGKNRRVEGDEATFRFLKDVRVMFRYRLGEPQPTEEDDAIVLAPVT